jgi:hypothetical protein
MLRWQPVRQESRRPPHYGRLETPQSKKELRAPTNGQRLKLSLFFWLHFVGLQRMIRPCCLRCSVALLFLYASLPSATGFGFQLPSKPLIAVLRGVQPHEVRSTQHLLRHNSLRITHLLLKLFQTLFTARFAVFALLSALGWSHS